MFTIERVREQAERARVEARKSVLHGELLLQMGLVPEAPVTLLPTMQVDLPLPGDPMSCVLRVSKILGTRS